MNLKLYKWIFLYLFLGPLDFGMTVFAWLFVNWWAPIFATRDGWLPRWLKWFQTFDADLDTGVRDGKIKTRYRYLGRVLWLYRNPAYGFSYYTLGCLFKPEDWTIKKYDNPSGHGIQTFYAISKDGHFNYMFLKHFFGHWWAFKLGWKAWNMILDDTVTSNPQWTTVTWGPLQRIPIVLSVGKAQ